MGRREKKKEHDEYLKGKYYHLMTRNFFSGYYFFDVLFV